MQSGKKIGDSFSATQEGNRHKLDVLLQANLPQFISALSAGLSPVKKQKHRPLAYSPEHNVAPHAHQHSPTASGRSASMQRSFSAVELHDPGLDPLQQGTQQQQQWHGHMRTASTDAVDSCWTESCSSTGSASPDFNSTAGAGGSTPPLLRSSWPLHGPLAEAGPVQEDPEGQSLQRKRLPPCPVSLWRPAPSMVRGAPLAEAVESPDDSTTPAMQDGPGQHTAGGAQQQHEDGEGRETPLSPGAHSIRASVARSSSIANLMQMLHGLLGSSSSRRKLQVQVPVEEGLDVQEFLSCHSPDATSRQLSRDGSRGAAASSPPGQAAIGGVTGHGGCSSRSSPAGSPRASGSFSDLKAFWSSFSPAGSKLPSRQPSNVETEAAAHHQQQQQPAMSPPHAQQQHGLQQGAPAAAAAASEGGPTSADSQGGTMHRASPAPSPSPSKRASLLHGPSRLSLISSVNDAGGGAAAAAAAEAPALDSTAAHRQPAGEVQQPDAAGLQPQQREGGRWEEAGTQQALHWDGPAHAGVTGAQHTGAGQVLQPAQPQDRQQQDVQRQLFVPSAGAPLQPAQPSRQQQQQQREAAAKPGQAAALGGSQSPQKNSMLWSLMHRKGSSSRPQSPAAAPAARPAVALAAVSPAAAGGTAAAASSRDAGTAALQWQARGGSAAQAGLQPQQQQASQDHSSATTAVSAAVDATAVVPAAPALSSTPLATPPPAGPDPSCSAAVGVMADSIQRIASCLEDYLCDRSPSVSPTKDTAAAARGAAAATAAAAGGTRGEGLRASSSRSQIQPTGRDQGPSSSSSVTAAGDAVLQQVTPKKSADLLSVSHAATASAGGWSPAAAAAKARMLAARSPGPQGLGKLAGVQDTNRAGAQQCRSDQEGSREEQGVPAGWLHPGDLRPAATAADTGVAGLQQQQPLSESVLQQHAVGHEGCLAQLPRGLRLPPGLGSGGEAQPLLQQQEEAPGLGMSRDPQLLRHQQQQQQEAPLPAAFTAPSQHPLTEAVAPGGTGNQLASLFALACRAVGVDPLNTQEAAAPAVAAAALTAAMAAAAAAHQQQSWQQAPDVDHAALAGHTSRQHQTSHSSRTVLWRAGGSKALAEQQHQQLGQGGLLRSSLAAQPSAGQQGHSRQQQQQHWQQPVMWGVQPPSVHAGNAGQQGCIGRQEQSLGKAPRLYRQEDAGHAGQPCSSPPRPPGVKLIKPQRASKLRLLQPSLRQPHNSMADSDVHSTAQMHQQRLETPSAHQQQRRGSQQLPLQHPAGSSWRPDHPCSSPVQTAAGQPQPKLVRLRVQQQAGAPMRPVLFTSTAAPAAPWLHPTADSRQGVRAAGVPAPVEIDGSKPVQQPVPWQALGWSGASQQHPRGSLYSHSSTTGAADRVQPAEQAAGRVAGSCGLGAGAAAARLLQGITPLAAQAADGGSGSAGYWLSAEAGSGRPAAPGDGDAGRGPASRGTGYSSGLRGYTSSAPGLQDFVQHAADIGMQEQYAGPARPAQPVRVVVLKAQSLHAGQDALQRQQQQQAPWQLHGGHEPLTLSSQHGSNAAGQQQAEATANVQQQGDGILTQQRHQQQQQRQHWEVTLPRSPVKSPRKHPVGRRWALLQRLKAINRSKAAAAAGTEAGGGAAAGLHHDPAAQLIAQLQELMQGGVGVGQQGSTGAAAAPAAVTGSGGSRPDLDAAAAMGLLMHLPSAPQGPAKQQVQSEEAQQQQQQLAQGVEVPVFREGGSVSQQVPGVASCHSQEQLDAQASLHSAAAQTSEVLGPAEPAAAGADAAVQAAGATVDAGTRPEQQQLKRQQGALELAQLILDALDQSGGVILPDAGANGSSMHTAGAGLSQGGTNSMPGGTLQVQGGDSWGLLPNPYAGAAAPCFQQVLDLQPEEMQGCWHAPAADLDEAVEASPEKTVMLQSATQQQQQQWEQPAQQVMVASSGGTPQHGCCFAACPRHIQSPELGESANPQRSTGARRTAGTAAGSSRKPNAGSTKQQQPPSRAGTGRAVTAVPILPRPKRSSTRSARQTTASSSRVSETQPEPAWSARPSLSASCQGEQQQQVGDSRQQLSPHTWVNERTKQLDELWQQWHKQQVRAASAAGQQPPPVQGPDPNQQPLVDEQQRQELDTAYARAAAARAAARKAAQHAANSRSQRLRAELMDLGRMLAEVDTLAAQMEVESTQAAAAVQQFEVDLVKRQSVRAGVVGRSSSSSLCVA